MCPTFFSSLKIRAMQRESHELHAMLRSPYSQSNALHCKKSHIKWFSQPLIVCAARGVGAHPIAYLTNLSFHILAGSYRPWMYARQFWIMAHRTKHHLSPLSFTAWS